MLFGAPAFAGAVAPFPRGADRGYAACRRRRFRGRASRGGLRQCLQVGVRARVPLWGVSSAVSESQRPDDLVCFVQRRRSGACLAWCRGFRHCCVAVSKSRGWGADVPWLVRWCAGALLGVGVVDGHPRGGTFQRCEGRLVLGAVPSLVARPPERAARVPRPVCPGCGRCGRVGPAPAPQRAPLRAGVARCGGGGRASLGGVPSTVVRGAWCQPLSLPRPPILWSGQPGFRDPCVSGAVDAGVWTQHRPHSVRPCGPALLAVGVAEGRPRGGVFHHCEGPLASGAVPPPAVRPLEPAVRVPRPGCPGCGRCGRGDPALAPQRAPMRAGVALLGGGGRASPGGVPSIIVRGAWCQPLSLPQPPVLWCGQPGFRVPCVPGAVGAGVGTQHRPHGVRPCGLASLAVRVAEGRPRGVPSTVVRGAWCQALSLPRLPVLWSGQPGSRVPCVPGAVGSGVGTQHRPHSVRLCGPALLAVGMAEGRPRGGCFSPL